MGDETRFRIAIHVPEVFYVLRNPESQEPDRYITESELIKKHLSDEVEPIGEEVRLGRDQIEGLCRALKSTFTTETKNITSFKSYVHNLESVSREAALQEVKNFLQEMRSIEQNYKGGNLSKFAHDHWAVHCEDFYFILKSIDLAGIRVVRDSSRNLTDEEKISLFLEAY